MELAEIQPGMPPTYAEIDLGALRYNIGQIQKKVAPAKLMAVVKANAYGHGAVAVARTALAMGVSYLAVARVAEAIELREHGITAPILVFGGAFPQEIESYLRHDLEMTIYSGSSAQLLSERAQAFKKTARIHLKVDTGMGRVGVRWDQAVALAEKIIKLPRLELVGLMTHFASSDERAKSFANLQLQRFTDISREVQRRGISIQYKHAANSGAILDLPEAHLDLVRMGMMMYGWYPSSQTTESVPIRPVMSFKTQVLYVKEIQPGDSVSYGRLFIADRPTRIATLPVGYADGYNRLLSNRGNVLIRGKQFPVVGRVCMDLIHVNLGADTEVQPGDEVVLFGRQGTAVISVYEIGAQLQTIPYEICCWISARVPRIYIQPTF
ncbi:alanine racemase [candidate division KSB1 bacterium]|nr:alanine racemase [candidate division KSB1 bacterium]